jgi:signal peptidase
MAPAYPEGALLVVRPVDPNEVRSGSVIVFDDPARPGRLVAHRVADRVPGAVPMFRTRGDANGDVDPYPVSASAVRGEVRWSIAGLGTAARALRWPVNAVVLIGVPALLLVGSEVAALRRRRRASAPSLQAASPAPRPKPKLVPRHPPRRAPLRAATTA